MKSDMEQEQTQKKHISDTRFWIIWGSFAGIILLGCLFYGWKTWALSQENKRFEISIENTGARLKTLSPGSEQLIKKRAEAIAHAEKFRTPWSTVMEQVTELETSAARFVSISLSDKKVSASCQTASWNSFSSFIKKLEADSRIKNLRISSTNVLSPAVAGAKQSAELTFDFSPTMP